MKRAKAIAPCEPGSSGSIASGLWPRFLISCGVLPDMKVSQYSRGCSSAKRM